jgi:hypothetical protein
VLVVVLPPLVLLGGAIVAGTGRAIGSGIVLTVLTAVVAQLGRDRGKRLEPGLWKAWGGSPTLRRLRYRDAPDAGAIARLHKRIEAVLDDPMPTAADEDAEPVSADARYNDATRRLIGLTRDRKQFHLLFAENINYGLRRNMLGLRAPGIAVATVTAVVAVVLTLTATGTSSHRALHYAPALGIAILEVLFWLLIVNRNWVRVPAESYGDRLIEAVDVLERTRQRDAAAPDSSVGAP